MSYSWKFYNFKELVTDRSAIFPDRPIRYRYRSNMADHRSDTDHNQSNNFELHFLSNVISSLFYVVIYQFQVILDKLITFSVGKVVIFGKINFHKNSYSYRYRYRYFAVIGRSTDIHRSALDRPITDNRYSDRSVTIKCTDGFK